MLTIKDIPLKGQKVLVRCDLNVPMHDGKIMDDYRIQQSLPTIRYLMDHGATPLLISHLGRPKGRDVKHFSMQPIAECINKLLPYDVKFIPDCVGDEVVKMMASYPSNTVFVLENVRFYPQETQNDDTFAKKLAAPIDVYVNDAFGSSHRAHASVCAITKYVKKYVMGLLLSKEVNGFRRVLNSTETPFITILGGAKVSDKIEVINYLLPKVDAFIVGGGMCYTFLRAMGIEIGKSLVEESYVKHVEQMLKRIDKEGKRIYLPRDVVVAECIDKDAHHEIRSINNIGKEEMALDIGPQSLKYFEQALQDVRMILWNGPMGVFEIPIFSKGTYGIAKVVAKATENGAYSIVGGGDSVYAVRQAGYYDSISHVSTGGGAALEYMEGKALPGLVALER